MAPCVKTVAPGWIETEKALAYLEQHLGASSEDCSDPAGYLTASWIEVDGGLHRSAF